MKNGLGLVIIFLVMICAGALGYYRHNNIQTIQSLGEALPVLDELSCKAAGGNWNACGSACRGMDTGKACITLCVAQCLCKADDDCPYGYACGAVIDGEGICQVKK